MIVAGAIKSFVVMLTMEVAPEVQKGSINTIHRNETEVRTPFFRNFSMLLIRDDKIPAMK